ncbi:hypothetical protein F4604DRAFT_1915973 [Suillus subluteus]|nr:hypothetical protein F4604DRAFT_1915973 [Suillus subluteus]
MPPLNTSGLADVKQALRELQLKLQELKDVNKELTEENRVLNANQPKRKKKGQNISEENMAFDKEIRLCGRKYASAESALLVELLSLLPPHIHPLVGDNHFADIFEDAMNSSCTSEIKKLCSKAGLIFGLPEQYFTDTTYNRASVSEIQCLLGTSTSQCMPKPFPPILFLNLVEDLSLRTLFGNWELFGKVIFLLSADKEFRYSSKGETMKIQYNYMFSSYKKILIKNWNTEYTCEIVKKLNNFIFSKGLRTTDSMSDEEDFTAAMDCALAGVTEGEESTAQPESPQSITEDVMDETVGDVEANRDGQRANSPLMEPDEDEVHVVPAATVRGHQGGRAARHTVSNTTHTIRNARTTQT